MTETVEKEVPFPPVIGESSFNCPHCGAHSDQAWYKLAAERYKKDSVPNIPKQEFRDRINANKDIDKELRGKLLAWADQMDLKLVFTENEERGHYLYLTVYNLNFSRCFSCKEIAVWLHDRLLFPEKKYGISPNPDMPLEIRNDFDEAREILERSPRGAAALLRLAIQKLCKHLGESGKHIDTDIANLVKKGLDVRIQQALDYVRVVGNNAVHPGQMDLKDDRDTARTLFGLVNLITEKMISEPKHVKSLYESLPEGALKAIENRDKKI